jgi:hypothetical protein
MRRAVGFSQHRTHIGVEQNGPIGNGGNQGFEFGFFGGQFFDVLLFVALQPLRHFVEAVDQLPQLAPQG